LAAARRAGARLAWVARFKPRAARAEDHVGVVAMGLRLAGWFCVVSVLVLAACTPEERSRIAVYDRKGSWLAPAIDLALPLLPDPAAAVATVPGVDSNGDWVRDDVEIMIAARYRDPHQVAALRRVAAAVQKTLVVGLAIERSAALGEPLAAWLPAAEAVMRSNIMSGACVAAVFGAYEDPSVERDDARAAWVAVDEVVQAMLDTDERAAAYTAVEQLVGRLGEIVKPLEAALNPCH
jgi:hypothetical protein